MSKQKNRKYHKKHKGGELLPFDVIKAAASGGVIAINQVLKRYEGYIIALSTKQLFDEWGKPYMVVDEEMRRNLETNLIIKIMQFDVNRVA